MQCFPSFIRYYKETSTPSFKQGYAQNFQMCYLLWEADIETKLRVQVIYWDSITWKDNRDKKTELCRDTLRIVMQKEKKICKRRVVEAGWARESLIMVQIRERLSQSRRELRAKTAD